MAIITNPNGTTTISGSDSGTGSTVIVPTPGPTPNLNPNAPSPSNPSPQTPPSGYESWFEYSQSREGQQHREEVIRRAQEAPQAPQGYQSLFEFGQSPAGQATLQRAIANLNAQGQGTYSLPGQFVYNEATKTLATPKGTFENVKGYTTDQYGNLTSFDQAILMSGNYGHGMVRTVDYDTFRVKELQSNRYYTDFQNQPISKETGQPISAEEAKELGYISQKPVPNQTYSKAMAEGLASGFNIAYGGGNQYLVVEKGPAGIGYVVSINPNINAPESFKATVSNYLRTSLEASGAKFIQTDKGLEILGKPKGDYFFNAPNDIFTQTLASDTFSQPKAGVLELGGQNPLSEAIVAQHQPIDILYKGKIMQLNPSEGEAPKGQIEGQAFILQRNYGEQPAPLIFERAPSGFLKSVGTIDVYSQLQEQPKQETAFEYQMRQLSYLEQVPVAGKPMQIITAKMQEGLTEIREGLYQSNVSKIEEGAFKASVGIGTGFIGGMVIGTGIGAVLAGGAVTTGAMAISETGLIPALSGAGIGAGSTVAFDVITGKPITTEELLISAGAGAIAGPIAGRAGTATASVLYPLAKVESPLVAAGASRILIPAVVGATSAGTFTGLSQATTEVLKGEQINPNQIYESTLQGAEFGLVAGPIFANIIPPVVKAIEGIPVVNKAITMVGEKIGPKVKSEFLFTETEQPLSEQPSNIGGKQLPYIQSQVRGEGFVLTSEGKIPITISTPKGETIKIFPHETLNGVVISEYEGAYISGNVQIKYLYMGKELTVKAPMESLINVQKQYFVESLPKDLLPQTIRLQSGETIYVENIPRKISAFGLTGEISADTMNMRGVITGRSYDFATGGIFNEGQRFIETRAGPMTTEYYEFNVKTVVSPEQMRSLENIQNARDYITSGLQKYNPGSLYTETVVNPNKPNIKTNINAEIQSIPEGVSKEYEKIISGKQTIGDYSSQQIGVTYFTPTQEAIKIQMAYNADNLRFQSTQFIDESGAVHTPISEFEAYKRVIQESNKEFMLPKTYKASESMGMGAQTYQETPGIMTGSVQGTQRAEIFSLHETQQVQPKAIYQEEMALAKVESQTMIPRYEMAKTGANVQMVQTPQIAIISPKAVLSQMEEQMSATKFQAQLVSGLESAGTMALAEIAHQTLSQEALPSITHEITPSIEIFPSVSPQPTKFVMPEIQTTTFANPNINPMNTPIMFVKANCPFIVVIPFPNSLLSFINSR